MKDAILTAAVEVLANDGLNNWTVEEVASRAHCAKGLVNYHFRSKADLLRKAGEVLRDNREARRLAALRTGGTASLDALWRVLTEEVDSGWFEAWLSVLSAPPPLNAAAKSGDGEALARAAVAALGARLPAEAAVLVPAALDGIQLQIVRGAPPPVAEEAYHRFWLSMLG